MLTPLRFRSLLAMVTVALIVGACSTSTSEIPVASSGETEPTVAPESDDEAQPEPTVAEPTAPEATPSPAPTLPPPTRPDTEATEEPDAGEGISLADIDAAEEPWLRAGIVDYRYTIRYSCECDDEQRGPLVVTVRNGRVDEVLYDGEPSSVTGHTTEDLFATARDFLRRGEWVEMTFAPNGFPTEAILDVEATWVDGGVVYRTSDLEILAEGPPVDDDYIEALQRWRATGIESYRMTYRPLCFCPQVDVTVTVVDGVVVDHETTETFGMNVEPRTIEGLFTDIRRAVNGSAHSVTAEYHPSEGYPVSFFVDEDPQIADEEYGIEVVSFDFIGEPDVVLPDDSPAPPDAFCQALIDVAELDDQPDTAAEARGLLNELRRQAEIVLESAPADLIDGAGELVRFIERIGDLAAAQDWDPDFFDALDDEVLASLEFDVVTLEAFLDAAGERCGI